MDFSTITTLIGSFGFPIVACILLGWYVKYQTDQNKAEVDKMTEEHRTEMQEVTVALNNNTLAIQKLCDKLEIGDFNNG